MIQSRATDAFAADRLADMNRSIAPRAAPSLPHPAILAALAALALAACATQERLSPGLETTILPATIEYACDEGRVLTVERAAEAVSATATLGTRRWVLPRGDSVMQEKYSEGTTALYLEGDIAMLESEGRVLAANCRSKVALPKAPAMRPYKF